jgi:hypothetical protein
MQHAAQPTTPQRQHPHHLRQHQSPPHQPKLLPVVTRVIEQVNHLFVEYFGGLGERLAEEVFKQWLIAGKTGPSGLRHYVNALGRQLEHAQLREGFMRRADSMLLHLQSGYVS